MSLGVSIESAAGCNRALVTTSGQLVVGPVSYDEASFNTLDTVNVAYNFYGPRSGKQFVITTIVVFADKDINDATATVIQIYEADSQTSTVITKTLVQFGMAKLTTLPIVPLNLLVTQGKFVNAKTDDDDVHMTIMGYYIDAIG